MAVLHRPTQCGRFAAGDDPGHGIISFYSDHGLVINTWIYIYICCTVMYVCVYSLLLETEHSNIRCLKSDIRFDHWFMWCWTLGKKPSELCNRNIWFQTLYIKMSNVQYLLNATFCHIPFIPVIRFRNTAGNKIGSQNDTLGSTFTTN